MASKKKGKPAKNNASSGRGNKTAGASQTVVEPPANPKKFGHEIKSGKERAGSNPAKSPEEMDSAEPQTIIWRKGKDKNSSAGAISAGLQGERFLKISQFLNEVLAEFRKISWPERSQVVRETVSVLFLVLLITVLVWGFDLIVGKFVFSPLEHLGHIYGIGAKN